MNATLIASLILMVSAGDIMIINHVLTENDCSEIISNVSAWDSRLYVIFSTAIQEYAQQYDPIPPITQDNGYKLMNTTPTTLYIDTNHMVGAILMLNDNVAGGQWYFPRQKEIADIEPTCGKLIMFPSGYTHPRATKLIRLGVEWFISTYFR
jgi:hypothetical protein